jgi:hypothetical protein
MSRLLDTCPACGERGLIAVCRTTVEYTITNEGDEQSWDRREVDDDDSTPTSFRCDNCRAQFSDFTLDRSGYLVSLGSANAASPAVTPEEAMTAAQFESWLIVQVNNWCQESQLQKSRCRCISPQG